ncbi:hypothetical protein D9619_011450 [Psilocybe cf. subviscida]|uniref:Uncharacterized protein n=1 Tax=Psilocybe cf. subviscida TaxID=2480587 RepID=A0A8H5BTB5_9AGAR|nr:hypothetical protein D9619_011450 [Psilocybe cf. subviscida]
MSSPSSNNAYASPNHPFIKRTNRDTFTLYDPANATTIIRTHTADEIASFCAYQAYLSGFPWVDVPGRLPNTPAGYDEFAPFWNEHTRAKHIQFVTWDSSAETYAVNGEISPDLFTFQLDVSILSPGETKKFFSRPVAPPKPISTPPPVAPQQAAMPTHYQPHSAPPAGNFSAPPANFGVAFNSSDLLGMAQSQELFGQMVLLSAMDHTRRRLQTSSFFNKRQANRQSQRTAPYTPNNTPNVAPTRSQKQSGSSRKAKSKAAKTAAATAPNASSSSSSTNPSNSGTSTSETVSAVDPDTPMDDATTSSSSNPEKPTKKGKGKEKATITIPAASSASGAARNTRSNGSA